MVSDPTTEPVKTETPQSDSVLIKTGESVKNDNQNLLMAGVLSGLGVLGFIGSTLGISRFRKNKA